MKKPGVMAGVAAVLAVGTTRIAPPGPGTTPPPSARPAALARPATAATPVPSPARTPTVLAVPDAVLVGAGDIASCRYDEDERTALLLDRIPGTVFTLGDNAYPDGTADEFRRCYEPSWGRHRSRTRPVPGNHDYRTSRARGYFDYFGANAGDPKTGYYAYGIGTWRVLVLNSNCRQVGGCQAGSAQEQWVRRQLAKHPTPCTVAMWHHPRFSSSEHGDAPFMRDLWKALQDGGADLVLAGHDHIYERFAPLDAEGRLDPRRGMRSFVVGTGGRGLYGVRTIKTGSEVRNNRSHGVLKLTLHPESYDWEFVPVEGATFRDSGSARCRVRGGLAPTPRQTATPAAAPVVQ